MDHPFSFLLAAIVCICTAFYIVMPLRRRASSQAFASGSLEDRSALLERRDALLRDLKDLEFDRNTGKISDADYSEMRAAPAEEASVILQKLEAGITPQTPVKVQRLDIEAEVEVLIARARRRLSHKAPVLENNGAPHDAVLPDAVLPDAVLPDAVRTAAFQAGGWACTSCGRVMGKYDRFCASCGATRPE